MNSYNNIIPLQIFTKLISWNGPYCVFLWHSLNPQKFWNGKCDGNALPHAQFNNRTLHRLMFVYTNKNYVSVVAAGRLKCSEQLRDISDEPPGTVQIYIYIYIIKYNTILKLSPYVFILGPVQFLSLLDGLKNDAKRHLLLLTGSHFM